MIKQRLKKHPWSVQTLGVFWENSYFLRSLSGIKYKIIKNGSNSKLFHKELENNPIQIYIKNITVRIIFLIIETLAPKCLLREYN